jgi:hypothetical membrane protein
LLPIVFFTAIAVSLSDAPWFKWTNNALSDLGLEGISAVIFNNSLIIAGFLALIFSIGLTKILSKKTGAYLLSMSAVALIFIGLFPGTIFIPHYISSATFFVLLVSALIVMSITIRKDSFERNMALVAFVFAVLACFGAYLLTVFNGLAIPEAFACFPAFLWFATYGLKMTLTTG